LLRAISSTPDDHAPPHFHVITRSEERVAVRIDTLQILAGEADARDIEEALTWASENRAELIARWRLYSEQE
jgi:hypothetical protein